MEFRLEMKAQPFDENEFGGSGHDTVIYSNLLAARKYLFANEYPREYIRWRLHDLLDELWNERPDRTHFLLNAHCAALFKREMILPTLTYKNDVVTIKYRDDETTVEIEEIVTDHTDLIDDYWPSETWKEMEEMSALLRGWINEI